MLFLTKFVRRSFFNASTGVISRSVAIASFAAMCWFATAVCGIAWGQTISPSSLPGIEWVEARPVAPRAANRLLEGRLVPSRQTSSTGVTTLAVAAAVTAPEIVELARGLRHDPNLIYEFVHNEIAYTPVFGLRKGAVGTLIDREGNSFDQAELMVALLRASNFTANFVYGTIRLDATQLMDWLGVDNNAAVVEAVFGSAGIPATVTPSGTGIAFADKSHVWVKVTIDGANYVFDPAYKSHTWQTGIDLATVMGYDQATFTTSAMSGTTLTADSIQHLNDANIRSSLQTYATNLVEHIRTNDPGAKMEDIVGGPKINPVAGMAPPGALPYQQSVTAEWVEVPDTYRVSVRVQYQAIDQTRFADEIYGKRLTLFFAQTGGATDPSPTLGLDGTPLQTGDPMPVGTTEALTVTIDNPYAADGGTFADVSKTIDVVANGSGGYSITLVMGSPSPAMVEKHRRATEDNRSQGHSDFSEKVMGASLATLGYNVIAQLSMAQRLANRMQRLTTIHHQWIELVGHTGRPFVEVSVAMLSVIHLGADPVQTGGGFRNFSGIFSAFEAVTIEQTHSVPAADAHRIINIRVNLNDIIYETDVVRWQATQGQLVNYSAADKAEVQQYIDSGHRVILPRNGATQIGDFQGYGFLAIANGRIAPVIRGGSKGAASGGAVDDTTLVNNTINARPADDSGPRLSVDPATGDLSLSQTDFSVGSGAFPFGLTFQRFYSSRDRWRDGPLGRGWRHNFDISVEQGSNGYQALGQRAPVDAAASIAALYVGHDLLAGGTSLDRVSIASVIHTWFSDELTDNMLVVVQPGQDHRFVRLADGSFNPPPGQATNIVEQTGGGHLFTLKNQVTLDFDDQGRIESWQNPNGVTVTFQYDIHGRLDKVDNGMESVLILGHLGDRIRQVEDTHQREVRYNYDANDNLWRFTDELGNLTTYRYAVGPGLLTEIFRPEFPSTAFVTNIYDDLDRVTEQHSARGHVWRSFYGGKRTERLDPLGRSTVWHFDDRHQAVRVVDALGNETLNTYDGQQRVVTTTLPEGNTLDYVYDTNHNISQITATPKPASSLPPIVRSFEYDQSWNKLKRATDALGRTTDNELDPANGNLLTVLGPPVDAERPTTRFTYNARGQVLTTTDPTNKVALNAYDPTTAQLLSVTDDSGFLNLTTAFEYDGVGNVRTVTDPNGNITRYVYDDARRLIETKAPTPFNHLTQFVYDDDGRIKVEKREAANSGYPFFNITWQDTSHVYDPAGNRISTTTPGEHVTNFEYDELNRVMRVTDAEGRIVETIYDDVGRVSKVVEVPDLLSGARRDRLTYTYTPNGKQETLTDANGNPTTFDYDGFDRLERTIYPDTSFEEVTYDANGNVLTRRTRGADLFIYAYDTLNRLETEDVPYSATNNVFAYDLAGRMLTVIDESGSITNTYDTAGRLETVTRPDGKVVSYDYDAAGNRTRLTWPDGWFVTYGYDELNLITTVRENGLDALAIYAYDILSRRTLITYGDDTTATYDFVVEDNDLRGIDHASVGETVSFDYGYNDVNERTSEIVSDELYLWRPSAVAQNDSYSVNDLTSTPRSRARSTATTRAAI